MVITDRATSLSSAIAGVEPASNLLRHLEPVQQSSDRPAAALCYLADLPSLT